MSIQDIWNNYSGIVAIFGYLLVLIIIMSFRKGNDSTVLEDNTVKEDLPLDINDEDATIACLIASIDYRNECHEDIRIKSVRKVG